MRLAWTKKTRRGFFLRAEDFFNFARRINAMGRELEEQAAEIDATLTGYGRMIAKGSVTGQREALRGRYGSDADARSHGEAFLHLMQERFVPGGLHLMDEPEAPLSPQRQLSLLSLIKEMVEQDAQFLVATHSPTLMALEGATILSFNGGRVGPVGFDDVEHVRLMKDFLNDPGAFLRRL